MKFQKLELRYRELLEPYLYSYGEGSCQHSFASMYCMVDKYGDEFCEWNHCLYIHRSKRDTDAFRVYLAPMGQGDLKKQIEPILHDAHQHGKKVRFESVTETFLKKIREVYPKEFSYQDCRGLYEYIYTNEKLAFLPGHSLASKRTDINRFWRVYGEKTEIQAIKEQHLPQLLDFQKQWLCQRADEENTPYLEHENIAIQRALENFSQLGLSGIVIRIEGQVRGYAFGSRISPSHYDVMIEKGDRDIKDIYRILNCELVKQCCSGIDFINREEDLDVEGLRKAKLLYYPDILMKKYIVSEV